MLEERYYNSDVIGIKKLIIDCDPGIDDALAIILAVKSQQLQIDAITTVAGNTSLQNASENVLRILSLLESETIAVYQGSEKPLEKELLMASEVHGRDGLANTELAINPQITYQDEPAVDFLISHILNHPNEITIIALGPLTNIASCILQEPTFSSKVKELIIMGGAIFEPGNISRTAEFNFFIDPDAAKIVLDSGIKTITLVPLDVTHKVIFTPELLETINQEKAIEPQTLLEFVYNLIKFYHKFYIGVCDFPGCPLHDPLAVTVAIDPSLVKKQKMDVKIATTSESFSRENNQLYNPEYELVRGQTIAELRPGVAQKNAVPNVNVCVDVDSQKVLDFFIKTITKRI
ncbi:MAG: nucleoside hydrolase [Candidatus Heimdallarchaeota archaeon]|nr:nucleoside hydrolase [Candidatus Heimdallarchaeota archaeon]